MKCSEDMILYMHEFLDEDISPQHEAELREHLQACQQCQVHFHELKKTMALIQCTAHIQVPVNFTANVMAKLPKEKRRVGMKRWFMGHPFLTAASMFFVLMTGSVFSTWNADQEFSVSKQPNLIVQNNTVIVPKGEVVKGNIMVKNGDIKIEGRVDGNVTVINGERYMASAGQVTGEIKEINEVFDWIWYHIKDTGENMIAVFE